MCRIDLPELDSLANELLEMAVLEFDQEAVVFTVAGDTTEVKKKYQYLRNKMYNLLDNKLNGDN